MDALYPSSLSWAKKYSYFVLLTTMLVIFTFFLSLLCLPHWIKAEFSVYWNVPSEQCHKYGLNFSEVSELGIVQNQNDLFKGDKIVILYDPGLFPALQKNPPRNGGVPQQGNLADHLDAFQADVLKAIPDPNFNGIGIIDFEEWRPIFRENWGKLDMYRVKSREIEKKRDPSLSDKAINLRATERFEKFAFKFFYETLNLAKKLRPKARWGYYAFPYCYNFTPHNPNMECSGKVEEDNERSTWLTQDSTAMYPSIYIYSNSVSVPKRAKMMQGRIQEALRIARRRSTPVIPYGSYKYHDTHDLLSKEDMRNTLLLPKKLGASGLVIWGASRDVSSEKKCQILLDYVIKIIGPLMNEIKVK